MPALWAKQSTALTVRIGPILDADGVEYAGAVIGDISITKNGSTAAMAAAATLTYDANGYYSLVTTTANTDTLGALQFTCNKAGYQMPVFERLVVPANVYDSIVSGSDYLDVATVEINAASVVLVAAGVWDRVLTGATHNITNSAGRRLRQIDASFVIDAGTAQAGGATSITLAASASSTNDIYKGDRVQIVGGTGAGENAIITAYNGTTKVATVTPAFAITPDNTSEYEIGPGTAAVQAWNGTAVTGDGDWSELQTDVDGVLDTVSYNAAALYGACADPQTSAETYAITINGSTYTLDYTSQTSAGVRGTTTRTKT